MTKPKPRPLRLSDAQWELISAALEAAYFTFDMAINRLDRIVKKVGKQGEIAASCGVAPAKRKKARGR